MFNPLVDSQCFHKNVIYQKYCPTSNQMQVALKDSQPQRVVPMPAQGNALIVPNKS
jgi:hypothetical protein